MDYLKMAVKIADKIIKVIKEQIVINCVIKSMVCLKNTFNAS